MADEVSLGAPWARYAERAKKLFELDPDVKVEYDDEMKVLTLYVDDHDKADALATLMPEAMVYGNVTLAVKVVPCNTVHTEAELYRKAFRGNGIFFDVVEGGGPLGEFAYALFDPSVVQLTEDDISEYEGIATLTCADLAESVLKSGDVFISSAILVESDE